MLVAPTTTAVRCSGISRAGASDRAAAGVGVKSEVAIGVRAAGSREAWSTKATSDFRSGFQILLRWPVRVAFGANSGVGLRVSQRPYGHRRDPEPQSLRREITIAHEPQIQRVAHGFLVCFVVI